MTTLVFQIVSPPAVVGPPPAPIVIPVTAVPEVYGTVFVAYAPPPPPGEM
jgi:hypothetical protein